MAKKIKNSHATCHHTLKYPYLFYDVPENKIFNKLANSFQRIFFVILNKYKPL